MVKWGNEEKVKWDSKYVVGKVGDGVGIGGGEGDCVGEVICGEWGKYVVVWGDFNDCGIWYGDDRIGKGVRDGYGEGGWGGVGDGGGDVVGIGEGGGLKVVGVVGGWWIIVCVMGCGLNGESFGFDGYLGIEGGEGMGGLKELEGGVYSENETEVLIESGYGNEKMLEDMLKSCGGESKLWIGGNISCEGEFIERKRVKEIGCCFYWVSLLLKENVGEELGRMERRLGEVYVVG